MEFQRRHIEGAVTTAVGAGPFRVISIPQLLPFCMWTVKGTVTQAPVGLGANAVTYNVQWGGRNMGTTSTNDATNPITSNPTMPDAGYAPGTPPAIENIGVSGLGGVDTSCLEVQVAGVAGVASHVTWSLEVDVTTTP
jgi:hypothetical protein